MLTPGSTSIMVSWMPPQYSPSHYNVSYSCQLLCNSSSTMTDGSVTVSSATTYTISSLAPGSSCNISVVAVYDSIGMSNTVVITFGNTIEGTKFKLYDMFIFTCVYLEPREWFIVSKSVTISNSCISDSIANSIPSYITPSSSIMFGLLCWAGCSISDNDCIIDWKHCPGS